MSKLFKMLFFSCLLLAQLPLLAKEVIFEDDFSTNSNHWPEGKTPIGSSKVNTGRGMYVIKHKEKSSTMTVMINLNLDESRDYQIEAMFYKEKGIKDRGYGFAWGGDGSNYYSAMVAATGYFIYGKVVDESWQDISPNGWIYSDAVEQGQKGFNKITIRKVKNLYNFEVNDVKIVSIVCSEFFGNKFGFNVNFNQTILVDWVKVEYL